MLSVSQKIALSTYNQTINKSDFVYLTTGTALIETPILTNGGDVIIVANKVVLNAPIDTRVYLHHGLDHFEGTAGNCMAASTFMSPQQLASYQFFYQSTNDLWDPTSQSYISGQAQDFPEMPESHTTCAPQNDPFALRLGVEEIGLLHRCQHRWRRHPGLRPSSPATNRRG